MQSPSTTEDDFQDLSAYERAGLEGKDPRCIPIKIDAPLPVGDAIVTPDYTAAEHDIWATLYRRQSALLPGRASREYCEGLEHLELPHDRNPGLAELSRKLEAATGWRV